MSHPSCTLNSLASVSAAEGEGDESQGQLDGQAEEGVEEREE